MLLRKPLAEAREYLASYPRVENTSSFCPTLGFQPSLVTGISYPVIEALCDEEEEGHDYPGFEGPVEIGAGIAQDEEGEDHEEVYY